MDVTGRRGLSGALERLGGLGVLGGRWALRSVQSRTLRVALRRLAGLAVLTASLALAGVIGLAWHRAQLIDPAPTLLLSDRHDHFLAEVAGEEEGELGYWPVEEVPLRVVSATIALEDRRFWSHPGVDPVAVVRAIWQNTREVERISGASTLAMQVARMQHPGRRTYARKAVEAFTALFLTQRHGREAVLRQYLRLAPYGNRIHGIAYAGRRYLDKPVEDLSWAEISFLCAMPQAPSRTNPFRADGRERAVKRGLRILDELFLLGVITREELELARVQIEQLQVPERQDRPVEAMHAVLYLEAELRAPGWQERLHDDPMVSTSLDLGLQRAAVDHTRDVVRELEGRGAGNAAVIVVDRRTHEVLASVGSTGYFDSRFAGAIDYTQVRRYPGSTLKPFVYALALERGTIRPDSVLDDLQRGPEGITNYDETYLGPLLPRLALANSRNVPAVRLLQRVGLHETYDLYRDLDLHTDQLPADHFGLGLAIGGLPVTLSQLVRAYTAISGEGRVEDLVWVPGYGDGPGRRVMDPETARQVSHFLADPQARLPSFPRMGNGEYPFPVAFKTGTSSDWRDAWTVAWTDRVLVGVWVGHPDYQPMYRLPGGSAAADLARRVLLEVHADEADGLRDLSFPPPEGWVPVELCAMTGQLADPACDRVVTEWFRPGQEPTQRSSAHLRVAVDSRNGLLATAATPAEHVVLETFVDLEPKYASWAASAGLRRPPTQPSTLAAAGQTAVVAAPMVIRDATPVERVETVVRVTAPESGLRLIRDPETPIERATVPLQVVVDPPVDQVVWYVDGVPWRVADYPYTARWPLEPGEHTFQARVPWSEVASQVVRVLAE